MSTSASKSAMGQNLASRATRYQNAALDGLNRGALRGRQRLQKPQPGEGVKPGTCPKCGMIGKHATPAACIEALRDRLSRFE